MNQLPPHTSSLFHGRHFDRCNHHPLRPLVHHLQAELSRLSGDDGRARSTCISHDNPEMGSTLSYPSSRSDGVTMLAPLVHHGAWTKPTSESERRWTYLYRAVDQQGLTVNFLLSEHRDIAAAKRFFTRAIEQHWYSRNDHARRLPCYSRCCRGTQAEWNAAPADESSGRVNT